MPGFDRLILTVERRQEPPEKIAVFSEEDYLVGESTPLTDWFESLGMPREFWQSFGIGRIQDDTVFPYISRDGNILALKRIRYSDPTTGKRDKDRFPFFVPAPDGYKIKKCFFGENKLAGMSLFDQDPVWIFESEKTAVLVQWWLQKSNDDYRACIAIGGAHAMTKGMMHVLKPISSISYFCDSDQPGREGAKAIKALFKKSGIDVQIIDLFENEENGKDAGDWVASKAKALDS